MVSSLFLSLLCLFLLVCITYIQKRFNDGRNTYSSFLLPKAGRRMSGLHCQHRSRKGWGGSFTSFKCCICLCLCSPQSTYCIVKLCGTSGTTDLEGSNVLFPCNTVICLCEESSHVLSLTIGFFYYQHLKYTLVWFLLDMLEKQQLCLTGRMTRFLQITFCFVSVKWSFTYSHPPSGKIV